MDKTEISGREIDLTVRRIAALDRELARRRKGDNLSRYNSGEGVHCKQLEFHRCDKRNRWVFGGNRSGKTECGAVETVWRARGVHPYAENRGDVNIWVVSLSAQMQRDIAQKKILHYLDRRYIAEIVMQSGSKGSPESGIIDFISVKNAGGGLSRIGFRNCEQGRDKFQGESLDAVWFDEEPPKDVYDECRMRVLDRRGLIYGTMTPLLGQIWVYGEIYLNESGDPENWYIEMEWADNPYLDRAEIEKLTAVMGEEELQSRRYGKFVSGASGLVYPEFDMRRHVIEPFRVPPEWYDNISIDPGLSNPLSAHWYAVDFDGNVYVIAEHYEAGQAADYHADRIKEICARLGWPRDSAGRIGALIDSAATSRTLASQKSVCELFYEQGINVNPRVDKDVFSGIQRVKRRLSAADGRRIYIFSSCQNLIRELKGYRWGAGDQPVKKDDHAVDEPRYYLASRPEAHSEERQVTAVMRDKERLIRKNRRRGNGR